MEQVKTFEKHDVIFREGAYEQCMYAIRSGSVNIYVNYGTQEKKLLATLSAGQLFGELGITEARPRTATAVAAENDTSLEEITVINFSSYFQQEPQMLLKILRQMSFRLRALTQEYLEARETIAEAIDTAKSGRKQSESLMGKLAKLIQKSVKPFYQKEEEEFEEAGFLSQHEEQPYVVNSFRKNEIVFREGDAANCLYDILWGTVGIYANYGAKNQRLLAELKAEEFFGEMGLLDHMPRTATAVVLEDNTKLQLISEALFSRYLEKSPSKVMMIMMHLSSRIRELTKDYVEVCRLAEEASVSYDAQREWAESLSDSIVDAYCMPLDPWDCYNNYYKL